TGELFGLVVVVDQAFAVRLHAHAVDAGVGAAPARHLLDRLYDVIFAIVERLHAFGIGGHPQPHGEAVYGDDAPGAEHPGAGDGKLAHGAAAKEGDGLGGLDVSLLGGLVDGREDVGQGEPVFVGKVGGDLQRADVGKGGAH